MKKIMMILILVVSLAQISQAVNGVAYIENAQVDGSTFSWELHFERTDSWSSGLLENALGSSAASFDVNLTGLTSPTLVVAPGGPLDNANYPSVTVQIINEKCIVDIQFALNALAGSLPLNTKTKLLTVSMTITNPSLTAQLSWDGSNTGFFDNSDATVVTTLNGSHNGQLPVELTNFSANSAEANVTLNWQTATEINNYGFEIERKVEEGDWEKIGFVDGNGNSNSSKSYSFTDSKITGGSIFYYRLKQLDNDGTYTYSDEVEVEVIPTEYILYQNYPNPFNPVTTIRFSLVEPQKVNIKLYDVVGQEVTDIVNKDFELGYHELDFDASYLASGVYIFRIVAGDYIQVKKMMLLK